MSVRCPIAIRHIPRQNISDSPWAKLQFHHRESGVSPQLWTVNNSDIVWPQFGESGCFCVKLFGGTGNLTYAMKPVFSDSFGVDHKVKKQRTKVVCLDLTKADHRKKGEKRVLSGKCLWAHFGVPCGTASGARLRRLNKKVHGMPLLKSSRFPDGIPGFSGLHLG